MDAYLEQHDKLSAYEGITSIDLYFDICSDSTQQCCDSIDEDCSDK